jgi:hypothetical protein
VADGVGEAVTALEVDGPLDGTVDGTSDATGLLLLAMLAAATGGADEGVSGEHPSARSASTTRLVSPRICRM